MPDLNTFSMLKERVELYKNDLSLDKASLAFQYLAIETLLDLSIDEIDELITDGPSDGGIDAIHINEEEKEISIFTFKYTEKFENTNKNFEGNDLKTLVSTFDSILDKKIKQKTINRALWEKVVQIWQLVETAGSANFKFYVCTNKLKPTADEIELFEEKLKNYRLVEFHYYDMDNLVSKMLDKKRIKPSGSIHFVDKQHFESSYGNIKGIVATVAANDLVELVKDPNNPESINENVFNDNVRVFKNDSDINNKIIKTALSTENYQFWYLNNGITIVCEECNYLPNTRSPNVELKKFQIVNGCQTTTALFKASKQEKDAIGDVLLLMRICVTQGENSIIEKIAETTNSQNPVTTRDLHSNDPIQQKLEDEFYSLGYFYERKANQYKDKPANKRINNELIGQICLAYYAGLPSEAKNNKKEIFKDKYLTIFNENTTARNILVAFNIYNHISKEKKDVQSKKRRKIQLNFNEEFIPFASLHLLYIVKLLGDREGKVYQNEMEIKNVIIESKKHMIAIIKKEQSSNPNYRHDLFFKDSKSNSVIKNYFSNL